MGGNRSRPGPELQMLPWHEYAGRSKGEGGLKKELSGAQLLGIVGIIGLAICLWALGIIWFSASFPHWKAVSLTKGWGPAAGVFAVLTFAGFWSHWRGGREFHGTDGEGHPDVLGMIMPHAHLMESGAVQLAVFGFQHGEFWRVVVLAQNRFDSPCDLSIGFSEHFNSTLRAEVPDGGVIMAWKDQRISGSAMRMCTRFLVDAPQRGSLIQRKRRNLLGRNSMQYVGVAALAASTMAAHPIGGAVKAAGFLFRGRSGSQDAQESSLKFADLAGTLPLDVVPAARRLSDARKVTDSWMTHTLWEPGDIADINILARAVAQVFDGVMPEYEFPFRRWSADAVYALHRT
jgi:hypothetical protein